jgi:hypothetical protein
MKQRQGSPSGLMLNGLLPKGFRAVLPGLAFCVCLNAQTPVTLGTSGNFTVLASSTVTNTGNTVVVGNVGVFPGTAVTGFPPGVVTGGRYTLRTPWQPQLKTT